MANMPLKFSTDSDGQHQVDTYEGYSRHVGPDRWRSRDAGFLLGARMQKANQGQAKEWIAIVDEALVWIAALNKIANSIWGCDTEHRRAVRQDLSLPRVDAFFTWLAAQAARVLRKSGLGMCFGAVFDSTADVEH
ncbi:transposase IS66 family protein [Rhizobium sp. PP-F2F-G20b]|nr:transposase IS66 family protein [Rhizobium sp. PP-F2F-G20b]